MKVAAILLSVALLAGSRVLALQEHPAKGLVLKVDVENRSLVVSCDTIPGYMDAMEMPFAVQDSKTLAALKPGRLFALPWSNVQKFSMQKTSMRVRQQTSNPSRWRRVSFPRCIALWTHPTVAKIVTVGQQVPDFALTDQAEAQIRLSQLEGKVVALTFGYSRCPNPNYCLRLSNNLAAVEKRFHDRAGRDLVLITIMIDPDHDQGATLVQYAGAFKANPEDWHFLTGSLPQIKQVAGMFGMNFWSDEGLLTHTLHTVVIDRQGRLASNIEGNQFTAKQLGDLVQTVMDRTE